MTASVVNAANAAAWNSATPTLSITTPAANNLLIACFTSRGFQWCTVPAGFTKIQEQGTAASGQLYAQFAYKIADGTETSITWSGGTLTSGTDSIVSYIEVSGLDAISPLEASAENDSGSIIVKTLSTGTATPLSANGLAVALISGASSTRLETGRAYTNSFVEAFIPDFSNSALPLNSIVTLNYSTTAGQETTFTTTDTGDQMYATIGVFKEAAGGAAAALASTATAQATSIAEATTGIPIAGASLSVATSAGVISTSINMAAAVSAIALSSGVIDTEIRLSVAAIAQALSNAGLDTQTLLSGTAAGQADAGGTLTSDGAALSGAANALADSNATITVAITMQGDALAEALSQAGLTAPGSGLEGSATAQADAAAVMLTQINMVGNSSAIVTGSGGIDTILQLVGAAAAASNTLGGLTAQVQFNAQAFVQALTQAGLTTDSGLAGDAQAEADASGWLKIKVGFDGAAVGEAVASGNLSAGAVDIPAIARWTTKAEKRIWTVKDERSWRVCA